MGWIAHRSAIMASSVVSVFLLLGFGGRFGLALTDNIFGTGLTVIHLVAVASAYTAFALWQRYI